MQAYEVASLLDPAAQDVAHLGGEGARQALLGILHGIASAYPSNYELTDAGRAALLSIGNGRTVE